MNPVLETVRKVTGKSKHVRINEERAREICDGINIEEVLNSGKKEQPFNFGDLSDNERLNLIFIIDSINFSYWLIAEKSWGIDYKDRLYYGSFGLLAAFRRALDLDCNRKILKADYLASLNQRDLEEILIGEEKIPLFDERLDILREIGNKLEKSYEGNFSNIIDISKRNALKLLDMIVQNFQSFYDSSFYNSEKIIFHKRAQLTIADVYYSFDGRGYGNLKSIDNLTAFADYKIPWVLRRFGILEYSSELSDRVDNKIEILHGSNFEVEIRASSILAVELMKNELRKRDSRIKSIDIDSWLWWKGRKKLSNDKPYHLTRCIYY